DGVETADEFALSLGCGDSVTGSFGYADDPSDVPLPAPPGLSLGSSPNPFTARTVIRFELDRAQPVLLSVHDARGRRVRVLAGGPLPAGTHRLEWDGRDDRGRPVAAGVYFFSLRSGGDRLVRKTARLR
ncbi:MAG TPA: FlgD immunoglobulin-like domain containing protein, partial [bacterium]|nr:FlgD immunoglobulin-like domain containing protein [bacterium]